MDIDTIRSDLRALRGRWSQVALIAGVNRKTIERLVADPGYNPTLATMTAIAGAIDRVREQPTAAKVD